MTRLFYVQRKLICKVYGWPGTARNDLLSDWHLVFDTVIIDVFLAEISMLHGVLAQFTPSAPMAVAPDGEDVIKTVPTFENSKESSFFDPPQLMTNKIKVNNPSLVIRWHQSQSA